MTQEKSSLTRRSFGKLVALAGAAALVAPRSARSEERFVDRPVTQGAGFYRFRVGEVELFLISDGEFAFNPPFPVLGVNSSEEAMSAALSREFIGFDDVRAHVNALLVRAGKRTILVDAGTGSTPGGSTGKLLPHLANAGFSPKDIDAVIVTHMHGDHVGGLLDASGKPTFPNAEMFLHEREHAFWSSDTPDLSKTSLPKEARAQSAERAKQISRAFSWSRIQKDTAIVPRVEAVLAEGHTPGHMALLIDGGGENQLLYITDAVHNHAIQMPSPDIYVAFDTNPPVAVETRKRLLERAASERLLVSGAHLPFPAVGHVRKSSKGYDWVPEVWRW